MRGIMRKTAAAAILLGALAVAPAQANGNLNVVHDPSTVLAVAGTDVQVAFGVVSECRQGPLHTCDDINVALHYMTNSGAEGMQATTVAALGGTQELVIPAAILDGAPFTYWLEFSQEWCDMHCWTATARAPQTGSYMVTPLGY
jgi:hypothetical protein